MPMLARRCGGCWNVGPSQRDEAPHASDATHDGSRERSRGVRVSPNSEQMHEWARRATHWRVALSSMNDVVKHADSQVPLVADGRWWRPGAVSGATESGSQKVQHSFG
eukprot:5749386-Prymnesium_polylepis.1